MAWNYKGLTTAVKLLKRIHHARATEMDVFANEYKVTFVKAFRERSASGPEWTDSTGKRHPKLPTTLSEQAMPYHSFSAAFYLDSGPMVLVWAGLMEAQDELMRSSVLFFRDGPDVKLYGYRPNPLNRPVLIHEISSCEPCYSWNIFHSWHWVIGIIFWKACTAFSPEAFPSRPIALANTGMGSKVYNLLPTWPSIVYGWR